MSKFGSLYQDFCSALERFREAMNEPKTELMRDATIKRFELCCDLSWKTMKAYLEELGLSCNSPIGCFKEGYRQGVLEYEDVWTNIIRTRNKTVHIYDEKLADEVYAELPQALDAFARLASVFKKQMGASRGESRSSL